jgi:hypothetical protein
MSLASASPASPKIIILDSCHSGIAGAIAGDPRVAQLSSGMTILTASTSTQYASEENGSGIFTALLLDALNGGAANIIGEITPGSVYAHIDQSLGNWKRQRPIFRTNVQDFVSLRQVTPSISLEDLHRLTDFFPKNGSEYDLNPRMNRNLRGGRRILSCQARKIPRNSQFSKSTIA